MSDPDPRFFIDGAEVVPGPWVKFLVSPRLSYDQLIDQRAAEALAEIAVLVRQAREEMNRRFAFIVRSRGQRRRYELARQLKEAAWKRKP